jgi:hypothetical protein
VRPRSATARRDKRTHPRVAVANAPPTYFAIAASGGVKALSQVLTNITTGLITSCDLVLSENPPDYDKINVVVDGVTISEGSAMLRLTR